ncbi:hypothetical protein [Acaryochloris sp. IP29b_bin.148]|uniref:hypothetical protein n=1 Tax=Acaryochloris sp. IP29b_bin.148 TaxID=2969218 RepID=UPI00260CC97D|nr:hypothetical protein [Acaryochloris sp. IP29b_bin.148]
MKTTFAVFGKPGIMGHLTTMKKSSAVLLSFSQPGTGKLHGDLEQWRRLQVAHSFRFCGVA